MSKDCNQRVVDADLLKKFPKIQEDEPVLIFFGKFLYTKGWYPFFSYRSLLIFSIYILSL